MNGSQWYAEDAEALCIALESARNSAQITRSVVALVRTIIFIIHTANDFQEYMKRLPYFHGELTQFPWGRIESDGTCDHDVIRALFQVLGGVRPAGSLMLIQGIGECFGMQSYVPSGPSFGYWSIPGGVRPHDGLPDLNIGENVRGRKSDAKYTHGEVLLGDAWPTDVDAWKLSKVEHIPRLFFDGDIPARPEPGQITDWKSWYAWRGLPLESPVALLMD
ncbi:hypothetical protein EWM64_g9132 [Hericium alpestre]|uniref:Uncharacterized protein n=1 Tax=Hericium alpestre TaxID=135208 RepID=A0A4Y9ZM27_9AGAM|nr:hypothetical protein EWM64_g9132 [Hericium alpestre]